MTTPAPKHPDLVRFLDDMTTGVYGRSRTESIRSNHCVVCGGEAYPFRDDPSLRGYTISGMCQACQDQTFSGE